MAENESCSVETDGHVLGRSETPHTDVLAAGRREDGREILRCCEMHWIVETGVGTNPSLKALRGPIHLS
jgi:hypothetical protein